MITKEDLKDMPKEMELPEERKLNVVVEGKTTDMLRV